MRYFIIPLFRICSLQYSLKICSVLIIFLIQSSLVSNLVIKSSKSSSNSLTNADEALSDFLSVYYPIVLAIRQWSAFVSLPNITFEIWLLGPNILVYRR